MGLNLRWDIALRDHAYREILLNHSNSAPASKRRSGFCFKRNFIGASAGRSPRRCPYEIADSTVLATVVQPDGQILIGGPFQDYDGTVRRGVAVVEVYPLP